MRKALEPLLLTVAIALPYALAASGQDFYIGFATRVLVFALAATSLNLIVGYGGMVAFGHAAFLGLGAYAVAILMEHGFASAWFAWPMALAATALASLAIGAISLRTRGVYFIMITLAFAQMLYYLVISLKAYGGDDGLTLASRSRLAPLDLADDRQVYFVALFCSAIRCATSSWPASSWVAPWRDWRASCWST